MSRVTGYRGRMAPSPTGWLHVGHARTFAVAHRRAREAGGRVVLRVDDLDGARCRAEFEEGLVEDLRWLGLDWDEGPDVGGAVGPYRQGERVGRYREAWERLRLGGWLFPCSCSRKDLRMAVGAPHAGEEEAPYPGTCRDRGISEVEGLAAEARMAWRFRVPEGEEVGFEDGACGWQVWVAGRDFGDFVVWRGDGVASYQLACVVDDAEMGITEVVRGEDLLLSTARQILLYRALGWEVPRFFHCPLVTDAAGVRLAKRHDALSVRRLREEGRSPDAVLGGP